jgi:hypothetical protein
MIDRMLAVLETLMRYWQAASAAIDGAGMTVALILLAAILAGAGGIVGWKMRLYGALVGGMLCNAVVKAMGGGFAAALAALVVVTTIGFVLGTTPLLLRLLRAGKARR